MRKINEYIIEKLKIDKDVKVKYQTIDDILKLIDNFLVKEVGLKRKYYFLNRIYNNHRKIQWSSGAYKNEIDKICNKIKDFLKTLEIEFDIESNKYSVASIIDIFITDKSIDDIYEKD